MPSLPWIAAGTQDVENAHLTPPTPAQYAWDGSNISSTLVSRGNLGSANAVNGSLILNSGQQRALQSVAFASSAISLLSALLAFYWFCMMRRSFRRDLVLLLIAGGSWKSLWFVIFGAVEFGYGSVSSSGAFCQVSGYMLEVAFESCDFAVLAISLHMVLQIFPPAQSFLANDGLYRVRYWVFALWIILPNLCAALAFVNPGEAYTAVGGFCFLPIRPFWYRLALFWIPRYLLMIFIMYVVIRIYRHVGREFEVFGQERDGSATGDTRRDSSIEGGTEGDLEAASKREQRSRAFAPDSLAAVDELSPTTQNFAPDDGNDSRKANGYGSEPSGIQPQSRYSRPLSMPAWAGLFSGAEGSSAPDTPTRSLPSSRRGSRQIAAGVLAEDFAPSQSFDATRPPFSVWANPNSLVPSMQASLADPPLAPIRETPHTSQLSSNDSRANRRMEDAQMQQRRRAIQRQLRLLFIYPIVYMFLWIIPSVVHFMNYSNHFAQHPIFALSVLQIFCLTIMTFADVLIFSWREHPWRHIPGSDSTFVGSLAFWRFMKKQEWQFDRRESRAPAALPPAARVAAARAAAKQRRGSRKQGESQTGLLGSCMSPWSAMRKNSGSNTTKSGDSPRLSQPVNAAAAAPPARQNEKVNTGPDGAEFLSSPLSTSTPPSHSQRNSITMQQRKRFSGGSDRKKLETDRAYQRLALERAEYAARQREMLMRPTSTSGNRVAFGGGAGTRKEWFDREILESFDDTAGDDADETGGGQRQLGRTLEEEEAEEEEEEEKKEKESDASQRDLAKRNDDEVG